MVMKVDLNSDMGEGFGPWRMGDDAALLDVITSANIACGFHAGDPDVMAETMRLAAKNGVGIGAHPGFADLKGFGRRRLNIGAEELGNMIAYQLGAAEGMARSVGANIRHFKLHGALANMCAEDATLAKTCYSAALRVNPEIILMVLAETAQQAVVQELGANWAGEIFADRAYEDDATLVDRSKAGAVLHDADMAAERILNMLREDAIIAESGKRIPAKIDTICLHGDTPEAVEMARALRTKLSAAGVTLTQF
ncbi:MAG: LamB/YcsF family protein [Lentibacter sp.]|jgi:5-oxoprolinase (ATP-hydrolysing) subunit A|uniref:LamB/YcsF family protein n=1 Tax=Lentibacter sp. TaxID=2024994 RepID=UPI00261E7374|nr:5-oxoprolinase subunit PxpA [Lentibacter sp.]MDG1288762.1 LamB/YcsF family protein [Lentibacter sp.]